MKPTPTELNLLAWRTGQPSAERLCADLLALESYQSIDPQCPLGGRDGLKDIICEKNGWKYIAAAHFPATENSFAAIQKKFRDDFAGVKRNNVNGIIFLTNQRLKPSERSKLEDHARKAGSTAVVYHLERIRVILDIPRGYGIRLEYLGIPMSPEEQIAFVSEWRINIGAVLNEQAKQFANLSARVDQFLKTQAPGLELAIVPTKSRARKALLSALPNAPTASLTTDTLCFLHRALCHELMLPSYCGQIRRVQNWVGPAGCTPETARYLPPKPDQVPARLETLLQTWRDSYPSLASLGANEKLHKIALFHHGLLSIHPFIDGNGRVGRALLAQQAFEILKSDRGFGLEEKRDYYAAMANADKGQYEDLKRVIIQSLFGSETLG